MGCRKQAFSLAALASGAAFAPDIQTTSSLPAFKEVLITWLSSVPLHWVQYRKEGFDFSCWIAIIHLLFILLDLGTTQLNDG